MNNLMSQDSAVEVSVEESIEKKKVKAYSDIFASTINFSKLSGDGGDVGMLAQVMQTIMPVLSQMLSTQSSSRLEEIPEMLIKMGNNMKDQIKVKKLEIEALELEANEVKALDA